MSREGRQTGWNGNLASVVKSRNQMLGKIRICEICGHDKLRRNPTSRVNRAPEWRGGQSCTTVK